MSYLRNPAAQKAARGTPLGNSLRASLLYWRRHPGSAFLRLLTKLSIAITLLMLADLVADILIKGIPNLRASLFDPQFTTDNQSLLPSLVNTFAVTALALLVAIPLGVGGAIYLSEYAHRDSLLVRAVRLTAETLAGIPSILYGLFGMMFFVISLRLGLSILSGALTLSLMVLPLILRTTEVALLSVPDGYREGSYGLGAGKLRTVWRIVLPPAAPGILAGVVLAIGRIVGETAALLFTAGTVAAMPSGLLSSGRTLSVHMYVLSGEGLHIGEAYATAAVLLAFVMVMNGLSSLISRRIIKE
ncbi:MAG: phosphate ABC transporter permease PstA [Candidatus Limiplasma sp.]|nr:phosphate ABC transporter permease PstA [Candidatus Limiplasma sp.]